MNKKRVLKKISTMGGDVFLLISLLAALGSIVSIVVTVVKTQVLASWTLIAIIGLLILGISIIRTIANSIYGLIYKEKRITVLIGTKGTMYDQLKLAKISRNEVIFAGQNLTHLIDRDDFFSVISECINGSIPKNVKIILNIPIVLKYIAYNTPAGVPNLYVSVRKIQDFLNSLSESTKCRIKVYFHD